MITVKEYEEYNSSYYKTDITTNSFMNEISEHLCDEEIYEYKTTLHEKGLFFERKRKSIFFGFISKIDIIFSQRENYSLLAISYYNPVITKYFRFILMLLLLGIVVLAQVLSSSSNVLWIFNIVMAAVILFKDVVNSAIHIIIAKDINKFLKRDLNSPQKLKLQEYQYLLNDKWDLK